MTVSFSPLNYTVSEGIPAPLGLVLDKQASESITVFVTTMDITAGSTDYIQETSRPVKFAPGTQRALLPLLTFRDTVINEPNESLKATLDLGPTTVRMDIGPDPCFVTITDATGKRVRNPCSWLSEHIYMTLDYNNIILDWLTTCTYVGVHIMGLWYGGLMLSRALRCAMHTDYSTSVELCTLSTHTANLRGKCALHCIYLYINFCRM